MMVRAEDAGSPILRVLVQPVNASCNNDAAPVAHQNVVQHQPGQRMERVTPRGNRGWDAKGKPRSLEQPPRGLVTPATQIEVCSQHRCVVGDRLEQVPCLLRSAGSAEPAVPGGTARIQMSADQTKPGISQTDRRRNGYTALKNKGELNGVGIVQGQGGQNGISPIARCRAIPHGRRVPEVQSQGSSRVHDILLLAEPGDEHSSNATLLERWNCGVAPVRLLYHDDQRKRWIRPQVGIVTVPDPPYDRAELATPDPEVPAQDDETTGKGLLWWRSRKVQRHVQANIAAPLFQTPPRVVFMPREAKISGVGFRVFDGFDWPPDPRLRRCGIFHPGSTASTSQLREP